MGAWFAEYRFILYGITFTLLGVSFYRTYTGRGDVSTRNKRVLWAVAAVSVGLTVYSIVRNL
jgi:hypothetical protein